MVISNSYVRLPEGNPHPIPNRQQLSSSGNPREESTAPSAQLGVGHGADGSPGLGGGAVLHDGAAFGAWKMAGDAGDTWGNHRNLWVFLKCYKYQLMNTYAIFHGK